jgi:uncharacterized protein (TIGR02001 family)
MPGRRATKNRVASRRLVALALLLGVMSSRTSAQVADPSAAVPPSDPIVAPNFARTASEPSPDVPRSVSIDLGGRGGPAGGARAANGVDGKSGPVEFTARAGGVSDYIYRGVTLSNHHAVAGAALEASLGGMLYATSSVAGVRLPTQPAAEFTFAGGFRPRIGNFEFDFAQTYFVYPGERRPGPTNGVNYMELSGRVDTNISERIRIASMFAYSPNVSNTGAWSKYAALGAAYEFPGWLLPKGFSASLSGGAGYSWFGRQGPVLGAYRLPAYTHWGIGVTVSHSVFNFDLRYSNTSLSKERCYVFTGDPGAARGGRIDPISNPDGLASRWCGAAYVAKFWIEAK